MGKEDITVVEQEEVLSGTVEDFMVIKLKTPIMFEGNRYDKIDLNGLENIKAADMVTINRRMTRTGNIDTSPEASLEFALNMANLATGIPLEFFEQLPPYAAIAVKGRVTSFLYRPV